MKYIMSINEMLNGYDLVDNEYYKETNGDDYNYSECIDIPDYEIKAVEDLIDSIDNKNIRDLRTNWRNPEFSIDYKEVQPMFSLTRYSKFFKTEDEYYIFVWNTDSSPKYWRCDQLDGLLKLIKDLLT